MWQYNNNNNDNDNDNNNNNNNNNIIIIVIITEKFLTLLTQFTRLIPRYHVVGNFKKDVVGRTFQFVRSVFLSVS